ncbi:RebB family R body protein [Sneathiella sp.]|jgi:hypothetical protein|uniref:RebB family R body protein n=1 Tax=Sneathiella sp. TaxID=1964365 RepID=UPI0039E4CA5D
MTTKTSDGSVKSVNSQITDAVTQSNMIATGMSAAHSMGTLYQTIAQSIGTSAQNAVSNQQNANSVNLAALSRNIQLILQNAQPKTIVQPIIVQAPPVETKSATKS